MYLYKTRLYKTPSPSFASATNDADLADFEVATKKDLALKITKLVILETTFELDKSYADFDALVDGVNATWANIKYVENNDDYILYLATTSQI